MIQKIFFPALAAVALSAADTEVQQLRAQLEQLRQQMQTMQAKLDLLEQEGQTEAKHHQSDEASPSSLPVAKTEHTHSPHLDMALVIDGSYVVRSKKDEELTHMEQPGIAHGLIGSHSHGGTTHSSYNAQNGFNLNYAELLMHGDVAPDLDANAVFHMSENSIEIEEAYFTRTNLPYALRLRGGKFLSDFGRLNSQHHHEWDFSDMPLVYEAFLGMHGINEIGVQAQWRLPFQSTWIAGIEALQGKNSSMFGQAAIIDPNNASILSASSSQPSLYLGYLKTAQKMGSTSLIAGASVARGESRLDHFADETPYAFSGRSSLYGLDLTLSHTFEGLGSLRWQSEWLGRHMEGTQFNNNGTTVTTALSDKRQSGYYTQLIFAPKDSEWRFGGRYDMIDCNNVNLDGLTLSIPKNFDQYTAMIEYTQNEVARYRLQYTHSNAFFDETWTPHNLDTLLFSINLTLGEHEDHDF